MHCSQCGIEISDDSKFCQNCGAKINRNAEIEEDTLRNEINQKKDNIEEEKNEGCLKRWFIILLKFSIGAVIALFIIGIVFGDGDSGRDFDMTLTEMQNQAARISYDNLLRYPDENEGEIVEYRGKVIQKISDTTFRVNINQGRFLWEDTVYLRYRGDQDLRLIEDDIIQFWGIASGEHSYTAVLGNRITIPRIDAYYIDY